MSLFSFRVVAKGCSVRSVAWRWLGAGLVAICASSVIVPSAFVIVPSAFVIVPSTFVIVPSTFVIVPSTFVIVPSTFVIVPSAWAAAEKESKGDGKAHYKRALAKVKEARYASAIEDLKKALKANEKNADFWSLYGFAARKAGSVALAEQAYARALTLDPNHLGALEYSGELYVETQRMDEARERLARLAQLCPQGCRERTLLEQAIAGQGNDGTHKW